MSLLKSILLLLLLPASLSLAKGKKIRPSRMSLVKATYTSSTSGGRIIGDVYEFKVMTGYRDILIDSVWFGYTPVPCDVYETKSMHKVQRAEVPGTYLIRANKDLYRHFFSSIDSTQAAQQFIAPQPFKGVAMIFYQYQGKRYILRVPKAESKPQKMQR